MKGILIAVLIAGNLLLGWKTAFDWIAHPSSWTAFLFSLSVTLLGFTVQVGFEIRGKAMKVIWLLFVVTAFAALWKALSLPSVAAQEASLWMLIAFVASIAGIIGLICELVPSLGKKARRQSPKIEPRLWPAAPAGFETPPVPALLIPTPSAVERFKTDWKEAAVLAGDPFIITDWPAEPASLVPNRDDDGVSSRMRDLARRVTPEMLALPIPSAVRAVLLDLQALDDGEGA